MTRVKILHIQQKLLTNKLLQLVIYL